MAKPRSGYKRPYSYQPPPGIRIEISETTYQRLKKAARANRCTIGQWAETTLCNYRRLGMNLTMPSRPVCKESLHTAGSIKAKSARHFEISEAEFDAIEAFAATRGKTARRWIAASILNAPDIEMERLRGIEVEHEWVRNRI